MTLGREVVDKILIDIPAVLSLTIQGALVLGMFLLATLFDSVDITLLFVIYILFWSMQYTTTSHARLVPTFLQTRTQLLIQCASPVKPLRAFCERER